MGAVRGMPCSVRTFAGKSFARVAGFFFAFGVSVFGSVWRLRVFMSLKLQGDSVGSFFIFPLSEVLLRFCLVPRWRSIARGYCPRLFAMGFFCSASFQEFAESLIQFRIRCGRADLEVIEFLQMVEVNF
jgi:hypothetical protein